MSLLTYVKTIAEHFVSLLTHVQTIAEHFVPLLTHVQNIAEHFVSLLTCIKGTKKYSVIVSSLVETTTERFLIIQKPSSGLAGYLNPFALACFEGKDIAVAGDAAGIACNRRFVGAKR